MKPLTLEITGMSCGHCLNAVNAALGKLEGVSVKSARIGRAEVEFDPARTTPDEIAAAVSAAGYAAVPTGSW
jgi:copper chaperone